VSTTTLKIKPTGKSCFPIFYLRADWAQASATVMVMAGPDNANLAEGTWHAMMPNQVADYGHDWKRAALDVIREWNQGDEEPSEDFACEEVSPVNTTTIIDAHGNNVLACIACQEEPAATCAGCGAEAMQCAGCLDGQEGCEVGPNPDSEEREPCLWSCPECAGGES